MGRAALELIGRGGFGYSFDDLVSESKHEFAVAVKALKFVSISLCTLWLMVWEQLISYDVLSRPAMNDTPVVRELAPFLRYLGPPWFRRFLLYFVPVRKIQRLKVLTDTLSEAARGIYLAKKTAIERGDIDLLHSVGESKDVMSVLCEYGMVA